MTLHSRSLIPDPIDARKAKQAFQPTKPEDRIHPLIPASLPLLLNQFLTHKLTDSTIQKNRQAVPEKLWNFSRTAIHLLLMGSGHDWTCIKLRSELPDQTEKVDFHKLRSVGTSDSITIDRLSCIMICTQNKSRTGHARTPPPPLQETMVPWHLVARCHKSDNPN